MPGIFLDVGAHEGLTLEVVADYGFDHIYSFEPMPEQFAILEQRFGDRPDITLLNYGLSNRTCELPVYGSNSEYEASVYQAPGRIDDSIKTTCRFVRATDWVRDNLDDSASPIIAKLNCEGSEADILEDLIISEEIWRFGNIAIAFDIRRFPQGEYRYRALRDKFEEINFEVNLRWQMLGWNVPPGRGDIDYRQMVCDDWLDRLPRWDLPPVPGG